MNCIVIANCIVSRVGQNGMTIRPIRLEQKINPNVNINSFPRMTTGNRNRDHHLLQQLSDGLVTFDDIININIYPQRPLVSQL